jgi:hypothetical protein
MHVSLAPDVFVLSCTYLDHKSLINVQSCNKSWNNLTERRGLTLWKNLLIENYPERYEVAQKKKGNNGNIERDTKWKQIYLGCYKADLNSSITSGPIYSLLLELEKTQPSQRNSLNLNYTQNQIKLEDLFEERRVSLIKKFIDIRQFVIYVFIHCKENCLRQWLNNPIHVQLVQKAFNHPSVQLDILIHILVSLDEWNKIQLIANLQRSILVCTYGGLLQPRLFSNKAKIRAEYWSSAVTAHMQAYYCTGTLLHNAATTSVAAVKSLMKINQVTGTQEFLIPLHTCNNQGINAFHVACLVKNVEVIFFLLSQGADAFAATNSGETCINLFLVSSPNSNGNDIVSHDNLCFDLVVYFLKLGVRPHDNNQLFLFQQLLICRSYNLHNFLRIFTQEELDQIKFKLNEDTEESSSTLPTHSNFPQLCFIHDDYKFDNLKLNLIDPAAHLTALDLLIHCDLIVHNIIQYSRFLLRLNVPFGSGITATKGFPSICTDLQLIQFTEEAGLFHKLFQLPHSRTKEIEGGTLIMSYPEFTAAQLFPQHNVQRAEGLLISADCIIEIMRSWEVPLENLIYLNEHYYMDWAGELELKMPGGEDFQYISPACPVQKCGESNADYFDYVANYLQTPLSNRVIQSEIDRDFRANDYPLTSFKAPINWFNTFLKSKVHLRPQYQQFIRQIERRIKTWNKLNPRQILQQRLEKLRAEEAAEEEMKEMKQDKTEEEWRKEEQREEENYPGEFVYPHLEGLFEHSIARLKRYPLLKYNNWKISKEFQDYRLLIRHDYRHNKAVWSPESYHDAYYQDHYGDDNKAKELHRELYMTRPVCAICADYKSNYFLECCNCGSYNPMELTQQCGCCYYCYSICDEELNNAKLRKVAAMSSHVDNKTQNSEEKKE